MSASTANRTDIGQVAISLLQVPVKATEHIYDGIMVCTDANGDLVHADDAADQNFFGLSEQNVDNSSSLSPQPKCQVTPVAGGKLGIIEVYYVNPTRAICVGEMMAIVDDHTVALLAATAHVVRVGRCIDVTVTGASGKILVDTTDREATNIFGS